jgi:hypothetical protein
MKNLAICQLKFKTKSRLVLTLTFFSSPLLRSFLLYVNDCGRLFLILKNKYNRRHHSFQCVTCKHNTFILFWICLDTDCTARENFLTELLLNFADYRITKNHSTWPKYRPAERISNNVWPIGISALVLLSDQTRILHCDIISLSLSTADTIQSIQRKCTSLSYHSFILFSVYACLYIVS